MILANELNLDPIALPAVRTTADRAPVNVTLAADQPAHEPAAVGVQADHDLAGHVELLAADRDLRDLARVLDPAQRLHGLTLPPLALPPVAPLQPQRFDLAHQPQADLQSVLHRPS